MCIPVFCLPDGLTDRSALFGVLPSERLWLKTGLSGHLADSPLSRNRERVQNRAAAHNNTPHPIPRLWLPASPYLLHPCSRLPSRGEGVKWLYRLKTLILLIPCSETINHLAFSTRFLTRRVDAAVGFPGVFLNLDLTDRSYN